MATGGGLVPFSAGGQPDGSVAPSLPAESISILLSRLAPEVGDGVVSVPVARAMQADGGASSSAPVDTEASVLNPWPIRHMENMLVISLLKKML